MSGTERLQEMASWKLRLIQEGIPLHSGDFKKHPFAKDPNEEAKIAPVAVLDGSGFVSNLEIAVLVRLRDKLAQESNGRTVFFRKIRRGVIEGDKNDADKVGWSMHVKSFSPSCWTTPCETLPQLLEERAHLLK